MPKNLLKKTFNFFQKIFDKTIRSCYHIQVSGKQTEQNSIRPDGQAVKTTPSHGVNPGSIPGQVILVRLLHLQRLYFFILNEYAIVAQLVAQRIRNAWVAGSSPASGFA